MTATELAKGAREALLTAQKAGSSSLRQEQCVGRYIDNLSVEERKTAILTGTIAPAVLARIEARIDEENRKSGANRGTGRARKPYGQKATAALRSRQSETEVVRASNAAVASDALTKTAATSERDAGIALELDLADGLARALPGMTAWQARGYALPLPVELYNDPVHPARAFTTAERLGSERWGRAKAALKALAVSVYGSGAWDNGIKIWRVAGEDAAQLACLSRIYIECDPVTGRALPQAESRRVVTATPVLQVPANEGEWQKALAAEALADPVVKAAEQSVKAAIATLTNTPTAGDATDELAAIDAVMQDEQFTLETSTTMLDNARIAQAILPASLADFMVANMGATQGDPATIAAALTAADPQEQEGLTGYHENKIRNYFAALSDADPMPEMPTQPQRSDFPDMKSYSDAALAFSQATLAGATTFESWANRATAREQVQSALLKELSETMATIERAGKQAAAQAEQKAKAEAAKAARMAARMAAKAASGTADAVDLDGMDIPTANPLFKPEKPLQALYKGLKAQIETRGWAQHVMLTGPPGTGKTTIAQEFAAMMGMPFLKVECQLLRDAISLFGFWTARGGETTFVETLFAKGIQAGGCVVLLDEINRMMDPTIGNGLLPLLDYRRSAWVDDLQKTIVLGDNIVVFATRNTGGSMTGTMDLDAALESRFALAHETRHLSLKDTQALLSSAFPSLSKADTDRIAKVGDALRNAYMQGVVASFCPGQRDDLAAADQFQFMGANALGFVYGGKYKATEVMGSGSERTHCMSLIQASFPEFGN